MSKRVLFYIPNVFQTPEREIMMSLIDRELSEKNKVEVLSCGGAVGYHCSYNLSGINAICTLCKKNTQKILRDKFANIKIRRNIENFEKVFVANDIKDFRSVKELRSKWENLGLGALASYLTRTRDLNFEGFFARVWICGLLNTSSHIAQVAQLVIRRFNPGRIYVYNGRLNLTRPVYELAKNSDKVDLRIIETFGEGFKNVFELPGCLPQDLEFLTKQFYEMHKNFDSKHAEDLIKVFYENKINNIPTNDRVFTDQQTRGLLPEGVVATDSIITLYTSSEDEFAALGGFFDKQIFRTQLEAVEFLANAFEGKNEKLVVRMHPNLSDLKWSYVSEVRKISKNYPWVILVEPESKISTYDLLMRSEKVITFGSTIGIEAVYWGIPSIMIGRCIYEITGSVYVPETQSELFDLLFSDLPPKDKEGARRFALYYMGYGREIAGFSGCRKKGFLFRGQKVCFNFLGNFFMCLLKSIEKMFIYVNGIWLRHK